MKWEEHKYSLFLYPRDIVQFGDKTMDILYKNIKLKKGDIVKKELKRSNDAVKVLTGKALYGLSNVAKTLQKIESKEAPFFLKGMLIKLFMERAYMVLNNLSFSELPNQFVVNSWDMETGELKVNNLPIVKNREVNPKFNKEWYMFLDILPEMVFNTKDMDIFKLGF